MLLNVFCVSCVSCFFFVSNSVHIDDKFMCTFYSGSRVLIVACYACFAVAAVLCQWSTLFEKIYVFYYIYMGLLNILLVYMCVNLSWDDIHKYNLHKDLCMKITIFICLLSRFVHKTPYNKHFMLRLTHYHARAVYVI